MSEPGERVVALIDAMEAKADRLNAQIASCHERVACPKCWAPVGARCRAMPAGYVIGIRGGGSGRQLKNPHRERWTQEVPAR